MHIEDRKCRICGMVKSIDNFHRNRTYTDGYQTICKPCAVAKAQVWRDSNKDRVNETVRKRQAIKPRNQPPVEGIKTCTRCHATKHVSCFGRDCKNNDGLDYWCSDCEKYYHKQWRDANRDSLRRKSKVTYRKHISKIKEYQADHREKNRELRRLQNRMYHKMNPDKHREGVMRRNAIKRNTTAVPVSYEQIWTRDQGICYLCNQSVDRKDCHFDHIIPLAKGGTHTADNIAVTHALCNQRKSDRVIDIRPAHLQKI
jgi:5-methylcytosine-specific restriction endonuclease McrA